MVSDPKTPSKSVKDKTSPDTQDVPTSVDHDDSVQEPPQNPKTSSIKNRWALETDRVSMKNPIVECLHLIAGHYGRRTSVTSLTAGLPSKVEELSPTLFDRMAQRADLKSTLVERTLKALTVNQSFPCILLLHDDQACILWESGTRKVKKTHKKSGKSKTEDQTYFIVEFPETAGEKKTISLDELAEYYTGYCYYLRTVARADDRAGPSEIDTKRSWFWGALRENKVIYKEVALAAVMINLFALATPLFTMNVYDRVVPNNAYPTLWVLAAGVLTVFLFDFLLKNLRTQFLDHAGRKADVKISTSLFEQILGMTMAARPSSAGILASHMREFESLRDFFTSATLVALIDLPFAIFFIGIIAVIGGPMAVAPLVGGILIIIVGLIMQGPLQKVMRESMNESALKNALLFETFTGLETVKVQASESHTQRRWEELTDKASRTSVKARHISSFTTHWAGFITQTVSVVLVIIGAYLIGNGFLTMGALIACVMLSSRAMAPLGQAAALMVRFSQSYQSLKQLNELMARDVERPKGRHYITKPSVQGLIEFRNVKFTYPGQTLPALDDISFNIQPGEHVGIIGAVGSGKTTLERLLLNLYQPDSGTVQLDGTDVRQIDPGDLRRNIGAVQQSPQLFYGSVRENITMGHETASEDAVVQAAFLAGVMDFLKDTSAGLDTQVGERGEALSGGQRQAVAVARALLYNPPVLVMDEPTASLDPSSENRLRSKLQHITKDRTLILITHRASVLSLVDKLVLMDKGRILDFGPRDDIIKKLQAREYKGAS